MIHVQIAEGRTHRGITLDLNIQNKDESFIHLVDNNLPMKERRLQDIVTAIRQGMIKGNRPELCEEGVGGTYFFRDCSRKRIGVFKPEDEEPFSINNPKGFSPSKGSYVSQFKEGIMGGEASVRECAAYLLDHDSFAGVPPTDLVLCQHPSFYSNPEDDDSNAGSPNGLFFLSQPLGRKVKLGSLQEFVDHDGDTEDMGPAFLSKFPVDEVHKIAVLDVRLCNADRHGGNILFREDLSDDGRTSYVLIPIDHGYTLPSTFADTTFTWMNWPQAKEKMSERTKDYIRSLDAELDIELLKQKFGRTIREEHFRVLRITTMLLKKAADADLSFYDIAQMMCRTKGDELSTLEKLCSEAVNNQGDNKDDRNFMQCLSGLLDMEIERILRNHSHLAEQCEQSDDDETLKFSS